MLELNAKGIKSAVKTVSQGLSQDDRIGGHGVPLSSQSTSTIHWSNSHRPTSRGPRTPKGQEKVPVKLGRM